MEPKVQLSFSQELATRPSIEPDQSGPRPASSFLKIRCNVYLRSTRSFSTWSSLSGVPNKTPTIPFRELLPFLK